MDLKDAWRGCAFVPGEETAARVMTHGLDDVRGTLLF